ncbi:MAG: VacJ family lipoprotein, partial [Gammaproteobacteria bacterium]|nr:VacJ family lipoprotein [Gammaproteobacteria bacterium]
LDLRYRLLAIDSQLEDAFDEYSFVRDAYLMRTQYQVYDGNPPEEEDFYDDECFDDEEDCEETEEID